MNKICQAEVRHLFVPLCRTTHKNPQHGRKSVGKINTDNHQITHRVFANHDMNVLQQNSSNCWKLIITGEKTWVYGWRRDEGSMVLLKEFSIAKSEKFHKFSWLFSAQVQATSSKTNKEFYSVCMRQSDELDLWRNILRRNTLWQLHHDNATDHITLRVRDFLLKNNNNSASV